MLVIIKEVDYKTENNVIEIKITSFNRDKYITSPEFNKSRANFFASRFAKANVTTKHDVAKFVNKADFVDKLLKSK